MTKYILRKDGIIEINLNITEDVINIQSLNPTEFLNLNPKWTEFFTKIQKEKKPSEFLKEISIPRELSYKEMTKIINEGSLEGTVITSLLLKDGAYFKVLYLKNGISTICFFVRSKTNNDLWYLIDSYTQCSCSEFRYRKTCKHVNMIKEL